MFELNKDIKIKKYLIENSYIYIIDDFYKNPDENLNFILQFESSYHKIDEYPSFNSVYFEDKRHLIKSNEIIKVYEFLGKICDQNPLCDGDEISTNISIFRNNNFNDYINNYWWPHLDSGYTGIVYFNENDFYSGTNLYKILNIDEEPPDCSEHYAPWRPKKNFELIYSIRPQYNRMVLFDGYKFTHGMNICNNDYFSDEYRINQVLFFRDHTHIDE